MFSMNNNIFKLKIHNKNKNLEKYLKPQWSWKTLTTIALFVMIIVFIIKDLEIDFLKLVAESSKYFGDIISRMLPPDFSNFYELLIAIFETIEIAFLGTFFAIVLSIPFGLFSARNITPNYFIYLISKVVIVFFRAMSNFVNLFVLINFNIFLLSP